MGFRLRRLPRISEEAHAFRESARSLARGLEAELTIVLDSMFPMSAVFAALRDFAAVFPTVPPRVYVQPLGAAAELLLDGTCMIGLLPFIFTDMAALKRFPLLTIDLIPVAAPDHPLAAIEGSIETDVLQKYVQLVLTDRSAVTAGRDYGVFSGRTWRLADLGAKHSMLLAGLGWGSMPAHLVEEDIARGRLKVIRPIAFDAQTSRLVMGGAYRANMEFGPAGRWMIDHLSRAVTQ
jgi:DNA-binding transcriptional LysR family regulator